jgi:hypothetical protein
MTRGRIAIQSSCGVSDPKASKGPPMGTYGYDS